MVKPKTALCPPTGIILEALLGFILVELSYSQVHWGNLSKIGVLSTESMTYKIMAPGASQYLVIKLMPNVTGLDNCTSSEVAEYESLLVNILGPINKALQVMTTSMRPAQTTYGSRRQKRFAGVVLAGAALGVATAAQITAGVALHQSNMNAQAIRDLKNSLEKSNQAIEEIRQATQEVVVAVQGVQDYINHELIPTISQMSCEIIGQKLGLKLLRYYTELLSIFGPSLRDPLSAEITIQALTYALGGDIYKVIEKLGYSGHDLAAVLESGGIKTRVVHADVQSKFIILSISYPTLSEVKGVVVHKLDVVSYNIGSQEWYTAVPKFVATNGYLISNFDESGCALVTGVSICSQNALYPMSSVMQQCMRGETGSCARTLVSGTIGNRFILSKGNIVANCASIMCKCTTSGTIINQDPDKLLTFIATDLCPLVEIEGITIQVGTREYPDTVYEHRINLGPVIPLEKLDVGTNLGNAISKLEDAKDLLDASNQILDLIQDSRMSIGKYIIWAAVGFSIFGGLLLLCCCKRYYQKVSANSTVINPTVKPDLTGTSRSYVKSL
ncbi:putative fusion protein [Porcine morbillivirus]|uniref:Fusion glycoprotein F0 n=1 Tax=Porcine morbillivirus TaxID=2846955 RepID=A0A8F1NJ36_9MONO|nr:putative fusion protein [Porcine morbillivirus]